MIFSKGDLKAIRDVDKPPSLLRRLTCAVFGHRWSAGSPGTGTLCLRCFNWKRATHTPTRETGT